jgi:hypothetical protein
MVCPLAWRWPVQKLYHAAGLGRYTGHPVTPGLVTGATRKAGPNEYLQARRIDLPPAFSSNRADNWPIIVVKDLLAPV